MSDDHDHKTQRKSDVLQQVGAELTRVQAVAQRYLQSNGKHRKRRMSEDEVRRVTEIYLAWLGIQTMVSASSSGLLTPRELDQATQGLKGLSGASDELHRIQAILTPTAGAGRPNAPRISFSD